MSAPMHVVVIGGGIAGMAAAFAATQARASVTVVLGGVGASALYAGAVDDQPWDELERAAKQLGTALVAAPLSEDVTRFARALGLWRFADEGSPPPLIATTAGVVRTARGHDEALLDLRRLAGRTVLIPRAERAGWDADSLARCLRDSPLTAQGTRFEVTRCPVLRFDEERDIVDIDLAARHDEAARLSWFAERALPDVRRIGQDGAALLLGPWLGAARSRAAELSERLGVPVGEALAATAGTAGVRFEAAREQLLAQLGARTVAGFATRIEPRAASAGRRRVELRDGEPIEADAIVLAAGGLVGGGIVFDPPEHGAGPEGAARIHPSLCSAVEIEGLRVSGGRNHGFVGSMHGPVLEEVAWPARDAGWLERAGIVTGRAGALGDGIFAAGDAVFGARRTVLAAVGSALAAGAAAALHAQGASPVHHLPHADAGSTLP